MSTRRRSLTHVGGDIEVEGDRELGELAAHAVDVQTDERLDAPERDHVHGFHAYPARMHPQTAARFLRALAGPGTRVLDPFCGSGTVLVEAMLAGATARGGDLNPLAVRLATAKTRRRDPAAVEALVEAARRVAAFADERRKKRAGATRRFGDEDTSLFAPHTLLELDSLRLGIEELGQGAQKADLALVLSSLLVKLSNKRGDTSGGTTDKRIAAGYPAKLFHKKTDELARRLEAFGTLLPPRAPEPVVKLDDATKLRTVPDGTVDVVLTSPPYAGTYDYVEHHALRLRWLGLDEQKLRADELGARRSYARLAPEEAERRALAEHEALVAALVRVLAPGGRAVVQLADGTSGRVALRADDLFLAAAEESGRLALDARVSQARPHFHDASRGAFEELPRREHVFVLTRVGPPVASPAARPAPARRRVVEARPAARGPRERRRPS